MKSVLIIGAGPGGYETAVRAVRAGLEVTLVTSGPLGGTCLNAGCIPTKCLCHSAEQAMTVTSLGMQVPDSFMESALRHKNETVEKLRSGIEFLLKDVKIIYGLASFVDRRTVKVVTAPTDRGDGAAEQETIDEVLLTADKIIIATGSESVSLPIPGADLPGVLDSTAILALEDVPKRLAVIGGGVIGLEFASVFAALGSSVTVLEYCKELLPRFDTDLAKRLRQALSKRGIAICTQAQVIGINETESGLNVNYLSKGKDCCVEADRVLMAVGRKARFAELGLEAAGVETSRRGIVVDGNMRTSNPDVYAIGDVNGLVMLAHAAVAQGKIALRDIVKEFSSDEDGTVSGKTAAACGSADFATIRTDIMPAAVFTVPEVAAVGLTEEECEAEGIAYRIVKSFYRANGKALAADAADGYCKIIIAEPDKSGEGRNKEFRQGQILGCHILGSHASDLMAEVAALMNFSATTDELGAIIHAHPTFSEVLVSGL